MIAKLPLGKQIFAALDVDDVSKAEALVSELKNYVGGFKVGPRLVLRAGPDWVKKIANQAPLFFDFKFYDIPTTMVAAVKAASATCPMVRQSGVAAPVAPIVAAV